MRDLVSCFSENSINISNKTTTSSSCSSYSSNNNACIPPTQTPSIQNTTTSLYKIFLSSQIHHLIKLTWFKNSHHLITTTHQTLGSTISVDGSIKITINSRLFKKKKGSKTLDSHHCKIEVIWDLSSAKFDASTPEPIEGFYVLVIVDSDVWLTLGNLADEALTKKLKSVNGGYSQAKVKLISRQEYFIGSTVYCLTKARFIENGILHEILIKCNGDNNNNNDLSVIIDKKVVIKVKRLQWNFRGNQSIFVDGLVVDFMWDVHDWFFYNNTTTTTTTTTKCDNNNNGVFMFRTRSGIDSRLWLDEKMIYGDKFDFSLLIFACKNP